MKDFRVKIFFRVFLITINIWLIFYLYYSQESFIFPVIVAIILIIQMYKLFNFLDLTNQETIRFLEAIKYSDFTQTFSPKIGGNSFIQLSKTFNEIIEKFKKEKREKTEALKYFQNVLQHIEIALFSFNQNGEIEILNRATKKLFGCSILKNISAIKHLSPQLFEIITSNSNKIKLLRKVEINNELYHLYITSTKFKINNNTLRLISIQNFQTEIEENELEAWQNLIKVLTHEIMNSVTPISSLAETMKNTLINADNTFFEQEENFSDFKKSIITIEKRSEALTNFVNKFRNISNIPKPVFRSVTVINLLERIETLFKKELDKNNIKLEINVAPKQIQIYADSEQIEQVIINLVINSIKALKNKSEKLIRLSAYLSKGNFTTLEVYDNGCGINYSIQDKIFIPFFTTTENGSGIGLNIAKQIMRLHKGTIRVNSTPDKESKFILTFY